MGLEEVEVVKRLFYYPRGREKKIDRLGRNGSWQGQQRFDTQLQDFLFFFPLPVTHNNQSHPLKYRRASSAKNAVWNLEKQMRTRGGGVVLICWGEVME